MEMHFAKFAAAIGLGFGPANRASSSARSIFVAITLAAIASVPPAVGEERLVPQFGNASAPTAIIWSPDGN
jgi:hypothetical protein